MAALDLQAELTRLRDKDETQAQQISDLTQVCKDLTEQVRKMAEYLVENNQRVDANFKLLGNGLDSLSARVTENPP